MFRLIRAVWYFCTGRFAAAADVLRGNKYVMGATYDNAIAKGGERFKTVRDAVAELMAIESTRIEEIHDLNQQHARLVKIKSGAEAAMQRRINALRPTGASKDDIEKDLEFIKHKAAFKDAASTLEQVDARLREKEVDLEERKKQIQTYKLELQAMQKKQASLRQEKHEALADVAIAQQQQAVNAVLAGISGDTTDKELAAAREERQRAKQKAKISAELAGNDTHLAENEYLAMASSSESDKELDNLLNWGEDNEKTLADAKVSE